MAFNLGDVLKNVSNLDTDREQIEYIDIDLIDDDPNNFYELSGIEELAANIELIGLQQPIRVRPNPDDPKRVTIVSGHRRRAAVRVLVEEGKTAFRDIPCIRERGEVSAAMQELRLIYANSDTRKLSSADQMKQAQRVEELLYKLKEEGVEFPGRMRDHVAQACQVSKSKLARLKVIRENLIAELMMLYEANQLGESVAYSLAQQPIEVQQVVAVHPPRTGNWHEWYVRRAVDSIKQAEQFGNPPRADCTDGCRHRENVLEKMMGVQNSWSSVYCESATCCANCSDLVNCRDSCSRCATKKAELQSKRRTAQRQVQEELNRKEAQKADSLKKLWHRFGEARVAAGISVQAVYDLTGRYCSELEHEMHVKREAACDINNNTPTPFGYSLRLADLQTLTDLCTLFGCSADYLLCRTDVPKLDTSKAPAEGWVPLEWLDGRERPHRFGQKAVGRFKIEGLAKPILQIVRWDGVCWNYLKGPAMDGTCVGWFPIPEEV